MSLSLDVQLADVNTLLVHAVKLLRMHVIGHKLDPECHRNDGQPCYCCRTVAFLTDNFAELPLCKVCGKKNRILSSAREDGRAEPCAICGRETECFMDGGEDNV